MPCRSSLNSGTQFTHKFGPFAAVAHLMGNLDVVFGVRPTASKRDHMVKRELIACNGTTADVTNVTVSLKNAGITHFTDLRGLFEGVMPASILPDAEMVCFLPRAISGSLGFPVDFIVGTATDKYSLTVAKIPLLRLSQQLCPIGSVVSVVILTYLFPVGLSISQVAFFAVVFVPMPTILVPGKLIKRFVLMAGPTNLRCRQNNRLGGAVSRHFRVLAPRGSVNLVTTILAVASVPSIGCYALGKLLNGLLDVALAASVRGDDADLRIATAFFASWTITRFLIARSIECVEWLFLVTAKASLRGVEQRQLNSMINYRHGNMSPQQMYCLEPAHVTSMGWFAFSGLIIPRMGSEKECK